MGTTTYYHHRHTHSQPTQPQDQLSNPQSRRTTNQVRVKMSGCCCFLKLRKGSYLVSLLIIEMEEKKKREEINTDLTSPLPSSPTPLHPSFLRVHALLSANPFK